MKPHWRVMICVGLMAMGATDFASTIASRKLPSAPEASRLNGRGLALLAQCCEMSGGESVLISPFSIDSAFALLWLGSSDPVKAEISEALGLPATMDSLAAANALLTRSSEPRILTSNSLWADHRFPLANAYSNLVNDYFQRSVFNFDNTKPEESAKQMNDFVAEKTQKMITNLVDPKMIEPRQTGLVLINTLYFKGRWSEPFEEHLTEKDYAFNQLNGKESLVSMMRDCREVRYCETNDCQVLVLPYKADGCECDFVAVLPTPALEVTKLLSRLSVEDGFAELLSSCSRQKVQVRLPKLDFNYKKSLVEVLKARGLVRIFEDNASSFPALTEGVNGVYATKVTEVVHATNIKLDESGTEAAASTAIFVGEAKCCEKMNPTPPTPVFTADHPYLGFIVERKTGLILFAGVFRQIGDRCRESRTSREKMEKREAKRRADFAAAMERYKKALEEWNNPSKAPKRKSKALKMKPYFTGDDFDF